MATIAAMANYTSVAVAFLVGAVELAAQNPEWLPVASNGPSGRYRHAMAYAGGGATLLFGGTAGSGALADTWLWDGAAWQSVATANAPAARAFHAMAYDAARQCVVLFGGVDDQGNLRNDTWEWTQAGWVQRSTVGPVARSRHALAYDSQRQRTVLFGGQGSVNLLGDTWEWNGAAWTPRFSSLHPAPRRDHALAYDPVRNRTVLVGGASGGTWEWTGSAWLVAGSSPAAFGNVAAVYDTLHGAVLAYFGMSGQGGPSYVTKLWDGATATWTASPAARTAEFPALAFDELRQRPVMMGGLVSGQPSQETVEYGYAPRAASATPYGSGCGAPALGLAAAANASPRIGTTFRADITNVPFSAPFVAFGLSDQYVGPFPLPLVLDGFGYLGCLLHHDAFLSVPCTQQTSPSTAAYDLAIPNVPALLTERFYLQAWSLAPSVNAGGAVLSNGLRLVIGNS